MFDQRIANKSNAALAEWCDEQAQECRPFGWDGDEEEINNEEEMALRDHYEAIALRLREGAI